MIALENWTWRNIGELADPDRLGKLAARFELELLECVADIEPENVPVLLELGSLYARTGRVAEGLDVDLRLVRLHPEEPVFHYNLACSYSLAGNVERAFGALRQAVARGYRDVEHLTRDHDLDNLKGDRRFREILSRLLAEQEQEQDR